MTTKTLPDSTTSGYSYSGSGVTLVNTGVEAAPGESGVNYGFVITGNNDTLINNGTVFGQRAGIYITGSLDSVINAAGKEIIATLPDLAGLSFYDFSGTLTNYGVISGYANGTPGTASDGVDLEYGGLATNFGTILNGGLDFGNSAGTVINSGVILGNAAYGGVYMQAGGTITNLAGGLISSNGATESYRGAPPYGIFIVGGPSTVTNAGTIDGGPGNAVLLAAGFQNRVIVDPGAVFVGTVNGGSAVDATLELASSASQGTLSGIGTQFVNFGAIAFDPSASWLVDASTSIASATITGFGATDTIDLSGFVAVSDTFSANTLVLTNAGNAHLTLHVEGTFTSASFTVAGDGSGGTDIGFGTASAALVYGQTVDEAGIVAASETVSAGTLTLFNGGGTAVGTVAVGTSLASGDFTLRSDGSGGTDVIVSTVFGTYAGGITLLTNPTTIAPTGNVGNTAANGKAVSGPGGTAWTLTNQGLVSETASGGVGVSLAQSGTIINASGGRITATGDGVLLSGGGAVTDASGGTITGDLGVYAKGAAATVINAGSIGATGTAAAGVQVADGGQVTNQSGGTITGYSGVLGEGATTVVNAGSIGANLTANNASGVVLFGVGTVTNLSGGIITGDYGVAITGLGTLVNAGTIAGNITNSVAAAGFYGGGGGLVTNQSGGVITGFQGVWAKTTALTVQNAGSIGGNASVGYAAGVYLAAGGSVTNQSGGTISGYDGVEVTNAAGTVVNAGVITGNYDLSGNDSGIDLSAGGSVTNQSGGTISGSYYGVRISGARGTVVNLGRIATNDFGRQGVYLADGGIVTNGASGGTAGSAYVLGYNGGVRFGSTGSDTLVNYGTINGSPGSQGVVMTTGTLINGASGATGALIESGLQSNAVPISDAGTVINYGTIDGAAANGESHVSYGVSLGGSGTVASSISNLGSDALIEGYVAVYAGQNATVTNAGTIEATQEFGGTPPLEAVIFGGGTNRLIVDPGAVFIGGVNGSGAFTVTPGGQTTVLGTANGVGTTTLELASGASAGTIAGLGTKYAGFASLVFDTGAQWTVTGNDSASGLGTLGIVGFTSGDTIDLTGFDALSRTFASNALVLGNGAGGYETLAMQGTFSTANVRIASDGSGGTDISLQLDLNYGDTVDEAGIVATTETVAAGVMTLKNGASPVGSIAVGGTLDTSDFTLQPDGAGGTDVIVSTVFGTYTSGVTLLTNPTTVANTATISAPSGSALSGAGGSPGWTISNYGVINGGTSAYGVQLGGGATLVAGSTLTNEAGGLIRGRYGVRLYNGSDDTIVNLAGGTIAATGTNADRAIDLEVDPGTVTNAGLISAQATGAFDVGVELDGGGTVINDATGTITGGWGVLMSGVGTVVNAGTIGGTYANEFAVALSSGDRLIVDPGAVFVGAVNGGWVGGASTLELASAAGAGTLAATDFTNFSTIDFDAGAAWTLAGATAALSGAIVGFTAGDTIDLTGFNAVSRTFASNALVLGNGAGGYETLHIQGSFTTANFLIADDGSGGTDITESAIPPGYAWIGGNGDWNTPTDWSSGIIPGTGATATISNAGSNTVTIGSGESIAVAGVTLSAGNTLDVAGTLSPSGTLGATGAAVSVAGTGTISGGTFGIALYNGGDIVTDQGTISGGEGIAATGTAASGNTVIDSGTIIGTAGTAVSFGAGNDLLQFQPGSAYVAGVVDGGGGTNTLAFAAGAGTLTGLNAYFTSFTAGTVAAGASWTLAGSDTLGSGLMLTNSGTLTVAGTLTDAGTILGGITLGFTSAPLTVAGAGAVDNEGSGNAIFGGAGTVVNDGQITATGTSGIGYGYRGVYLGSGSLDNLGTITASGNGAEFQGVGEISNSGVVYGGRWGITSRGLFTVTNTGTISGGSEGIVLSAGGFIDNSKLITGVDGLDIAGAAGTIDNAGTIAASYGDGVDLGMGGTVSNTGTGWISANGLYAAVAISGGAGSVTNAGTLSGYIGVSFAGTYNNTLVDTGTILGGGGTGIGFGGGDDLLQFQPSTSVAIQGTVDGGGGTNTLEFASGASTGTLTGSGADFISFSDGTVDAGADWVLAGSNTIGASTTLTNSGRLTDIGTLVNDGSITAPGSLHAGVEVAQAGTLGNLGTISAPAGYGVYIGGAGTVSNAASGATGALISGLSTGIGASGTATATVVNYGVIVGTANWGVNANEALDLTNRGSIAGADAGVRLGGGGSIGNHGTINATYAGPGAAGVSVEAGGVVNNGTGGLISATDWGIRIGPDNAASTTITNYGTLAGGYGVAVYGGNTLSQTLIDSGTITGSGGTAIALSAGNDLLQFVPGDAFIQGTVNGGGGTNTLQFAAGAGIGTLTGSNADFLNFQTASIAAGASWVLAGTSTLGAGTALTDAGTLTNTGFLAVDPPLTVTGTFINSSIVSAPGNYTAVYIADGGVVTNTAGGTITGGTVAVTAAGIATIDNFGTIQGTTFAAVAIASGTVINGGASAASASILGSSYGVQATGVATVTNYGTITASHMEGVDLRAGGSLDNLGVINANEYGVFLYGPGTAINSGTIAAFGGGIVTNYAADLVVNSGTVTGGTAGGGIILQYGGTVIDSGTIAAGYAAVLFRGTGSNLLVLENGYTLSGSVRGSASANSNVVELLGTSAANAVTANYNGLDLTRIGTIAFAPGVGNYATLQITDDTTLPGTVANFVGPHDTIDLTTLSDTGNDAVTSFDSATDQLTVTAGTASVVLQLDSENYSGLAFVAQQDGSGGTAITAGPLAGPPAIGSTEAGQTTGDAETIQPFASASITDPNGNLTETVTVSLSGGDADGTLSGSGLTETTPGLYSFTASDAAAATTTLESLVFTPTPHQVAAGDTVSTTFTVDVTDSISQSASDSTASVVVTAEASPPSISGALVGVGVSDQAAAAPFASAAVTDVNFGATDTATVSFDPTGGALSNLGGGSINDGTYTVTGTPAQVSAALDALTFTPAAPGSGLVATTDFALAVSGAGGTVSNDGASVTTVTQVLGLVTVPTGQITIAVSPDGSSFAPATGGLTNEAVVTAAIASGSYTLPGGYQAEYLGGSADAALTDTAVGGAILVGNTGNDTLVAAAANDSIVAGDGNNSIAGGSGQVVVEAGNGDNTISLPTDASYAVSTGSGDDTIFAAGSGTVSGGTGSNAFVVLGGANLIQSQGTDFISAAAGNTTVQASGSGTGILGGASGGTLLASVAGSAATVSAANDAATILSSGNDAVLLGGAQTTEITASGQADTIAGGAGQTNVTVTGNAGVLLGGAGNLNALVQGGAATIGGSAGAATVNVSSSALMFGNSGSLQFVGGSGVSTIVAGTGRETVSGAAALFGNAGSDIDYVGGSGGAEYVAGSGNETIDASGSSASNIFWGSANAAASDVMSGGGGADTLIGSAGAATLSGGGGANTFVFFHADAGGNDLVTDFNASDQVILAGYDAQEAGTALQSAVSFSSGTTLTLSDSTRITFLGVASASLLQGHLI